MSSLHTAMDMMRQDCWVASIDLKDAYYSVLVKDSDRKFLRFRWGDTLAIQSVAQWTCLCPEVFHQIAFPSVCACNSVYENLFDISDILSFIIRLCVGHSSIFVRHSGCQLP